MKKLLAVLSLSLALNAHADVKLAKIFSDHMVLQREQAVPIWGDAAPGEKVTVKFRNQEKTAVADDKGKWQVKLDALKAGGPDKLTVSAGNTVVIDDVLVGEVWVGSGQSNMSMGTSAYIAQDPVLAQMVALTNAQIRVATVNQPWQIATPESVKNFSALLFAFGTALQKDLNVPVGLMVGAVGGTPSGYWLTKEMLTADPACEAAIAKYEATAPFALRQQQYEEALAKHKVALTKWEEEVAAAKSESTQAVTTATPPPDKKKLPAKPAPPAPPIRAGDAPGSVGNLYVQLIKPVQPYGIRGVLWDQGESNTALQGIDQFTAMGALINGWRRAWEQGEFPFIYIQKPSGGGCAWDPSNAVTKAAYPFKELTGGAVPTDGDSVGMFTKIMTYPNTAMAISSDLGAGLHPLNKSGYGQRAATVALGMVYGKKIEYYGPLYASHKVEGDKVRVSFQHIGQGLAFKHGDKLQGFALAGADKQWQWADAVIDGKTVIVSSAKVPQPVAVRYAWSVNRPWANLFNKDGLPAIPFSTDQQ